MPTPQARLIILLLFWIQPRTTFAQSDCASGRVCSSVDIPPILEQGCDTKTPVEEGRVRIGLTTSLSKAASEISQESLDRYNIHIVEVLQKVSNFTRAFLFCVINDRGLVNDVRDSYGEMFSAGIRWFLTPADGKEAFAQAAAWETVINPGGKLLRWSLPWSTLFISDDFNAGLTAEQVGLGETPQSVLSLADLLGGQGGQQPADEEVGNDDNTTDNGNTNSRRLQTDSLGQGGATFPADSHLPNAVDITFDTSRTLPNMLKHFHPVFQQSDTLDDSVASRFVLISWDQDPPLPECAGIPDMANASGYGVVEVQVRRDLSSPGVIPAEGAILVLCAQANRQELVYAMIMAEGLEPLAIVFPKTNTANVALMNAPAYRINYNMEPTYWPSWEDLLSPPAGAVIPRWSTGYTEWWYWHSFSSKLNSQGRRDVIGPPPLIAHQLAAALQVLSVVKDNGYWNNSMRVEIPWQQTSIATFNGVVRFQTEERDGLTIASRAAATAKSGGTAALRQFKPWQLPANNVTELDYLKRFYFSRSTLVVANMTDTQLRYEQEMETIRSWRAMIGGPSWTELAKEIEHPLQNPLSHISDANEVAPRILERELEVLPCRAGCFFDGQRCQPCQVGTHRASSQLHCIACSGGDRYADVPGLASCRRCDSLQGCQFIDEITTPTAQANFYRVEDRDVNLSYVYEIDYCSQWGDVSTTRGSGDSDPLPTYTFVACENEHLCLPNNTCVGANIGDLCAQCPIGYSKRHKYVDLHECRSCPADSQVFYELIQSYLIILAIVGVILMLSYLENARVDSVQASLVLSVVMHLQVRSFMLELTSWNPYQLSDGALHLYLGQLIARPFDLSYTDCLMDQSDTYRVVQGLLQFCLTSYVIGLVTSFLSHPTYLGFGFCCRLALRRWRRFLASRKPKATAPRGSRTSQMSQEGNSRVHTARHEDLHKLTRAEKKYIVMYEKIEATLCLVVCLKRSLVWTMVFYAVLVRSAAQLFWCVTFQGSNKTVLMMEPGMSCNDPELAWSRALAAGILVVFGLGVPLSIAIFLHFELPNFPTISMRYVLGVLVGGYKQRYYAWETVKIARTGLIIMSGLIIDKSNRRTYVLLVCLLFVLLTMALEPHTKFHRAALYKAEALSSISLCIMIISSWLEELFDFLVDQVADGSLFERAFRVCIFFCRLTERYGDVFFLAHAVVAMFFGLVVLPVHIANRTGAAFRSHITTFLFLARWFYGINSVGVVTETVTEQHENHEHVHRDTYLYVGSLNTSERKVIKTGISEVLHVAVHNYDKFHPMMIVNALDEAAKRADMARKAITLHRQAEEEHGGFHMLWRLVVHNENTREKYREKSATGKRVARDMSSKYMDEDGYFTAEELYTTMQDVIMDIVDHHPLLKNVGRAHNIECTPKHTREANQPNYGSDRATSIRANVRGKGIEWDEEKELDEALFERLVVEHEIAVRKLQLTFGATHDNVNLYSDMDQPVAAGSSAEVDRLLHRTAGEITLMGFAAKSGTEIHELQRCIEEKKQASFELRRKLREELFGEAYDDSVFLLGLHAKAKPVKDNAHTTLLSPKKREVQATGEGFQQELQVLKAKTSAVAAEAPPAGGALATQVAASTLSGRPKPSAPQPQPGFQAPTPAILHSASQPKALTSQAQAPAPASAAAATATATAATTHADTSAASPAASTVATASSSASACASASVSRSTSEAGSHSQSQSQADPSRPAPRVQSRNSTASTGVESSSLGLREESSASDMPPTTAPAGASASRIRPSPASAPASSLGSAPASAPVSAHASAPASGARPAEAPASAPSAFAPAPALASTSASAASPAADHVSAPASGVSDGAWLRVGGSPAADNVYALAPSVSSGAWLPVDGPASTPAATGAPAPAPSPAPPSATVSVSHPVPVSDPARSLETSPAASAGFPDTSDPAKHTSSGAAGVYAASRGNGADRESPRGTSGTRRLLPKMVLSPKGSGTRTSPPAGSDKSSYRSSAGTLPSTERRRKYIWSPKVAAPPKIPEEGDFSSDLGSMPKPALLPSGTTAPAAAHHPPEHSLESTPRSDVSSELACDLQVRDTLWSSPEARRASAHQNAVRSNSPVRNNQVPPLQLKLAVS